MGLIDWLSDALGSAAGTAASPADTPLISGQQPPASMEGMLGRASMPPGAVAPPDAPPTTGGLLPGQVTFDDSKVPLPQPRPPEASGPPPGVMYPPTGDPMTAGGAAPGGPGLPVPLPAPRPAQVDPAALPPGATSTVGTSPQEVLDSYRKAGGTMMTPGRPDMGPPQQARGFIGRALGLDPNQENTLRGSLGAGLKAAGENSNKGKGAAFMGSAGSAIEGGQAADNKAIDQRDRYLQRAIAAKREGNHAEYQKNYLQYQILATQDKLAQDKEKAANSNSIARDRLAQDKDKATNSNTLGKDRLALDKEKATNSTGSVMNSPEQLYLRAIGATNQDAGIRISANRVRETQKQYGVDSKEAKAAMEEHETRMKTVRDGHLSTLGVDPAKIKGLENKPGFSDKNPVKNFPTDPAAAQKTFDALPDGAYFVNPKDGRLLIKKGSGGAQGQNPTQPRQQSMLTPPLAPMPLDIASENEAA